jgi:hypothetical protein
MWDQSYRPRIRTDLQYRELDDGVVIYDTAAERIHTLNLTAAYIWNCCDGVHNLSDIASDLYEQTKIPREQAMHDVTDAIVYFRDEGLLRVE